MNIPQQNILSAYLIIEELIRAGVRLFIIAPGSRSTPLALAAAENNRAELLTHFDERGAAFFALGYARAVRKPAAVICTSGSAVANLFPAVVEAASDNIPLILLTADRPSELQATGANQTINQSQIFGSYPRFQFNLNCSDRDFNPHALLTMVDQAVYRAQRENAGPVHLNCAFREPLLPEIESTFEFPGQLEKWRESNKPKTDYKVSSRKPSDESLIQLAKLLQSTKKGIILAGYLASDNDRQAVEEISHYLKFPVLPDITSGLRLKSGKLTAHFYDLILTSQRFIELLKPDVIIHFGGHFVSKRLLQALSDWQPDHYIVVNETPSRLDPSHSVTDRYESDISLFAKQLTEIVDSHQMTTSDYLQSWLTESDLVNEIISGICLNADRLCEAAVARLLVNNLPKDNGLFIASSMPIRNIDMFAPALNRVTIVGANRGASGIDGTIASACGFANGHNLPATLLIGDTALLHDLNSLALIAKLSDRSPLTIVVINNNGGGIFDHLPIAKREDLLDDIFVQPHGISFKSAASMFLLPYVKIENITDFKSEYVKKIRSGLSSLIEVKIDREYSISIHKKIVNTISKKLSNRHKK